MNSRTNTAAHLEEGDVLLLNVATDKTLAEWWCLLNRYEWPEKIPNPTPRDAAIPNRRGALMNEIVSRIGMKECLREWNKDSMPGEQFDEWYRNRPRFV